ncbi:hypothetical protein CYMTET_29389, partial [Cymbomonas tetramitiformis]
VTADLVHIDAAHEYDDVMQDIRLWWPLIEPGGLLMGDDYTIWWPGVVRAVNEFAAENNLQVYVDADVKWFYHKKHTEYKHKGK